MNDADFCTTCVLDDRLKECNKLKEIQGSEGNYNYDGYMLGVYNGMELILATMEGREPKFINGEEVDFLAENNKL